MSAVKRIFVLFALCLMQCVIKPLYADDADVLLMFRTSLCNDASLNSWNKTKSLPCTSNRSNWFGVVCDESGAIFGLQLENQALLCIIDIDTLSQLPSLRILSFANNSFDGPFPKVNKLANLRALYLTDNRFSGQIPDEGFFGMRNLKKLYVGNNQFSGPLPASLVNLPRLMELNVSGNSFSGNIPDFKQPFLMVTDFSYNNFEGKIPESLGKMGSKSFIGNKGLCGKPLPECKSSGNPL